MTPPPGTVPVAVVAFAQTVHRRRADDVSEVEMLMPVLHRVLDATGLRTADIGFTCSGSCDYLAGRAFSFTMALDGVGAWPPISESHVETDGAWAFYEAWVRLLTGETDTALVYAHGKSSPGSLRDVLTRQLDPYYTAPLWPDSVSLAALQARALIDAGHTTEPALAAIAARSRADAAHHPAAQLRRAVPHGEPL
ncbi:lipid-transfer protein, partial [Streptomyces sp. NPDC058953]